MTDVAARLAELLPDAAVSSSYGIVTADVPPQGWVGAVVACRSDGELDGTFVDTLVAVDEHPHGFDVVLRLWSVRRRHGFHLRTRLPRDDARLASLTAVVPGAAWHEREAAEMLGIVFEGHPDPRPLLLPDTVDGPPLRKERVLAARQAPWPGAVDPADRGGRPTRRKPLPPGAPPPVEDARPL